MVIPLAFLSRGHHFDLAFEHERPLVKGSSTLFSACALIRSFCLAAASHVPSGPLVICWAVFLVTASVGSQLAHWAPGLDSRFTIDRLAVPVISWTQRSQLVSLLAAPPFKALGC